MINVMDGPAIGKNVKINSFVCNYIMENVLQIFKLCNTEIIKSSYPPKINQIDYIHYIF